MHKQNSEVEGRTRNRRMQNSEVYNSCLKPFLDLEGEFTFRIRLNKEIM